MCTATITENTACSTRLRCMSSVLTRLANLCVAVLAQVTEVTAPRARRHRALQTVMLLVATDQTPRSLALTRHVTMCRIATTNAAP
jgi:hypothetical protein